jgi:exodeoxyribonuclease VII large subunit
LRAAFPETVWIQAEISECKEHFSGHCYLELIQKRKDTDTICAKARATIWANVYAGIRPFFEETTGSRLQAGQKVLMEVTVEFHELYGFNLIVRDIDPAYTLGDIALRRNEIIRQLTTDGVIDLNRELPWPSLPQRLAIISSPTAAGYEDFMDQLHHNDYGFVFYTAFFQAIMQGEPAGQSIVDAMDRILNSGLKFDAVVIIRGGGASADLSCFDQYDLCYYCAQYPLPILSGIGHDRDISVLDRVAHTSVKTPTAAAEHLLSHFSQEAYRLEANLNELQQVVQGKLAVYKDDLKNHSERLRLIVRERIYASELMIGRSQAELKRLSVQMILQHRQRQEMSYAQLVHRTNNCLEQFKHQVTLMEKTVVGFSPEVLIERGFSLTLHNGRIVRSVSELTGGEEIGTRLRDGMVISTVNKTKKKND